LLATDYQGRIEFAKPWGSTAMREPASLLRRLFHDKRGLSAVTVAVSLPVLFGVAGLGIDTGLWYTIKRQNQSAADAAALSAAYEVIASNTNVATNLTPAASQAATRNNYGGTTPVVTYPYSDAIVTGGVRVTLSQTQNAWFSSWFPAFSAFTIANAAVAAVNSLPPVCMLALNPTANDAVNLAGNPTINAPTCTIVSDSDSSSAFHLQGSATINAATLITPGQISHTGAAYTIKFELSGADRRELRPRPLCKHFDPYKLSDQRPLDGIALHIVDVGQHHDLLEPRRLQTRLRDRRWAEYQKQHGQPVAGHLLADW
jgi:Flp pilus assembly protein TadG